MISKDDYDAACEAEERYGPDECERAAEEWAVEEIRRWFLNDEQLYHLVDQWVDMCGTKEEAAHAIWHRLVFDLGRTHTPESHVEFTQERVLAAIKEWADV